MSARSNGRRERIETFEAGEQEDPVGDADHGDRRVDDVAYRPVSPPQHGIVQTDREDDHPHDDAQAEHCDADEDPTQGRHAERDDEEVQELVIARKTVDDPDREHRLVFSVGREMAVEPRVKVPVLHHAVPMFVHMENVELPQKSDHTDHQEHDRDEKIEMGRDAGEDRRSQRVEEERDDRRRQHVAGRPAHAHQTRPADAPAPGDQVRHRDEVIRVIAMLEPEREGQDDERGEFDGQILPPSGSTAAPRVTSSPL